MKKFVKFVINLKRRPDRLKQFFERCPFNDIEVIEAFDAKFPNNEDPLELNIFNEKLKNLGAFNRIGERGVFISHVNPKILLPFLIKLKMLKTYFF